MKQEIHLNEDQLREMVYNVIMEAADEGYLGNLFRRGVDAVGRAANKAGEAVQDAYNSAKEDYQNYNAAREPYRQEKRDAKQQYKYAKQMNRNVNGFWGSNKDVDYDKLNDIATRYKEYDPEIAYLIGQVKNHIQALSKKASKGVTSANKAYGKAKQNLKAATNDLDKSYGRKPATQGQEPATANLEEAVSAAVDKLLTEMTK